MAEIAMILNVQSRKIALLAERRVVLPKDADPGQGRARMYSGWHLVLLAIAFELEAHGVRPKSIREIVMELEDVEFPMAEEEMLNLSFSREEDRWRVFAGRSDVWRLHLPDPKPVTSIQIDQSMLVGHVRETMKRVLPEKVFALGLFCEEPI